MDPSIGETLTRLLPADDATRHRQLEKFLDAGLPTPKQERWKYTDLRSLSARLSKLTPAGDAALPSASASALPWLFEEDEAERLVFVDGRLDAGLSASSFEAGDALGTAAPADLELEAGDAGLFSLNRALAHNGVVITLPDKLEIRKPLYVVCIGAQPDSCAALSFDVRLGERSALTVVEHHLAADADGGLSSMALRGQLAPASRLDWIRVQSEALDRHHIGQADWQLQRDARLSLSHLDLGGRLTRHDSRIRLLGPGAHVDYHAASVLSGKQHVDHQVSIEHRSTDCSSRMHARGVADQRARTVFNGRVFVERDAQRTDSRQLLRTLLLSPHAEADCKPELEIYADDVVCSHGATVGQLDATALFYLRSRGLSEAEARAALTLSFLREALERVEHESLLGRLQQLIAAGLAGVPR